MSWLSWACLASPMVWLRLMAHVRVRWQVWGRGWDALSDDLVGETTMDVEASAFVAGAICVQVRACDAMSCTVMHCHGDSACGG